MDDFSAPPFIAGNRRLESLVVPPLPNPHTLGVVTASDEKSVAPRLSMPGNVPWQVLAIGEGVPALDTTSDPGARGRRLVVHRVDTLLEAGEVLKTARPSCVLVSAQLPDGDGLALIGEWPDMPFIVIGAEGGAPLARKSLEAGAQDYLEAGELAPEILVRAIRYATERKLHEQGLRRIEHEDRLSSLGRLAASVAHDVNNPASFVAANLSVLAGHVDIWESLVAALHARRAEPAIAELLASHELPPPGETTSLVQESRVGVERVVAIVRQLGSFARAPNEQEPFRPTSLNDVVEWACLLTRSQIQPHGRLELSLAPDLPQITARPGRLAQAVTNLLVNAGHALQSSEGEGEGVVHVLTEQTEEGVRLVVEDSGPGFEPSVLRRVFEPFFTTKGQEGTGLGLSIANEIVRAHEGSMEVGNRPDGRGARIALALPFMSEEVAREESMRPPPVADDDRRLRILVIDDERAIRRAYERMLRPHEVVGEDGADALERLRGGDRAFDMILCDLMMPEVDGIAVHTAVGEMAAGLLGRFVFTTGGAFTERVQDFLERTPNPVLAKPTSRDQILAVAAAIRLSMGEP